METLGCRYNKDQTGLFLRGRIPDNIDSCTTLTDNILENVHIFITPGIIFGKNGNRYIRISLCADEKTLLKAKERVEAYEL